MIVNMAEFSVLEDQRGLFLKHSKVDLKIEKISVPMVLEDGTGVIDIHERFVVVHPPNDESVQLSVRKFLEFVSEQNER